MDQWWKICNGFLKAFIGLLETYLGFTAGIENVGNGNK
jgi:hypothetical protein